jgi:hypothetical protein
MTKHSIYSGHGMSRRYSQPVGELLAIKTAGVYKCTINRSMFVSMCTLMAVGLRLATCLAGWCWQQMRLMIVAHVSLYMYSSRLQQCAPCATVAFGASAACLRNNPSRVVARTGAANIQQHSDDWQQAVLLHGRCPCSCGLNNQSMHCATYFVPVCLELPLYLASGCHS